MVSLKMYRSRKYLQRLLLTIVLLVLLTSLISSAVLFYYSEKAGLDIQYEANRKVLAQTKYNIDYMSEIVHNLGWSIYNDPEYANLFYRDDNAIEELYPPLRKLQNLVSTTTFLDSIMIYNSYNDSFYSTSYYPMDERIIEDRIFGVVADYLKQGNAAPQTEWVPFRAAPDGGIEFFTFFLYEAIYGNPAARNKSTLMMNVRTDWFFNNIKVINDLASEGSTTFVMDRDGRFLNPVRASDPDREEISWVLRTHIGNTGDQEGFLTASIGGEDSILTYLSLDNGWRIVSVQPYGVVFARILQLRWTYFGIAVALLLLSVPLSLFVSQRLYRPIQQMVAKIGSADPDSMQGKDEINYVLSVYNRVTDEMRFIRKHYDAAKDIAKNYYLRMIITNSPSFTEESFRQCIEQNNLNVRVAGRKCVVLLSIDDYKTFERAAEPGDRKLLAFAISNIATEMISKRFPNDAVDVGDGKTAILLSAQEETDPERMTEAAALLAEVRDVVARFYKLSITAAVSPFREGVEAISEMYQQAEESMLYRLVYGRGAIVTPRDVRSREEWDNNELPPDLERRWMEAIRLMDVDAFQASTEELFHSMKSLSYERILHTVLHMVFLLQQAVKGMERRKAGVGMPFVALGQKLLGQETLDDMAAQLKTSFLRYTQQHHTEPEEDRNAVLVDTMKEIIESDFRNLNLSLQSIADSLAMSDKYIGRQFKQREGVGVAEYINEVRLRAAVKLLEEGRHTVKEIMELVGFGNESQFFRVFKKRFGTTPGEYRLRRAARE